MNLHQQVREYVRRMAIGSPLWPRLRKIKGSGAVDDIIDRATIIVCGEEVPHFIRTVPELWSFFDHSPRDVRTVLLCRRALDTARKRFIKETGTSGGAPLNPDTLKLDMDAEESLRRFTEVGESLAMEPSRALERDQVEAQELDALAQRAQVEAEEVARLRHAINAAPWARKLLGKRGAKQRAALNLICSAPSMRGVAIALTCKVSESTVSKLRANVEELADQMLTIAPEEADASTPAPDVDSVRDAGAEQIAAELEHSFTGELEHVSPAKLQHHSAALNLAALFHSPDVEADVSDSAMLGYSKRQDLSWLARGQRWSGGRRMFTNVELVTGSYRGWEDPAQLAESGEHERHASKFSDAEMRELRERATAVGFALNRFMSAIDEFQAERSPDHLLASVIRGPKR